MIGRWRNSWQAAACGAAAVLVAGCSAGGHAAKIYQMGERAETGSLIYTVLDAEWRPQLGEGPGARIPANRFLLVRLSVTNSGTSEATVPAATLVDPSGRRYAELTDGDGVPDWLGLLRRLQPAETSEGRLIFDAPRSDYQLRVTDELSDPGDAPVSLIGIPLQFTVGSGEPLPARRR